MTQTDDMRSQLFRVRARSNYGLFTDTACKAERHSYPAITHSAARNLLGSIYLKHTEFEWRIKRVLILNPVSYMQAGRNEHKETLKVASLVKSAVAGDGFYAPIVSDAVRSKASKEERGENSDESTSDEQGRTQRSMTVLISPDYVIEAWMEPKESFRNYNGIRAIEEQFLRRLRGGKYFHPPFMGIKEFPADLEEAGDDLKPADVNIDIGMMIYDMFDLQFAGEGPAPIRRSWFHAKITNGILEFPPYDSRAVLKGGD